MNEKNKIEIGLLGSGGQADEAESYLNGVSVEFRAIDKEFIDRSDNRQIEILNPEEYQRILPVVSAIGAPLIRREMVEKWPGERFATIKSELSYIDPSALIGDGSIIAPRAVITTNVEIGKHTIINVAATISHDSKLGNFVTVGPGAHIAGNVELSDGVFVGIGAIISNNIKIAEGCVIGAGAVVINSFEEKNTVIVGSPAKAIKRNDTWLYEV